MHDAIEKHYYHPRFTVGVVNYGQEFVGSALRSVAEIMSCATRHYYPGTPGDFLLTIASDDTEEMMILSGHGTKKGMCFSESYSKEDIDSSMLLEGGYLPAEVVAEHLKISNTLIFGAFCHSGTDEMINAYACNGNTFIGNREPLTAHLCFFPVFLTKLLYGLLFEKKDLDQSFEEARSIGQRRDRKALVLCRDGRIVSDG